MSVSSVYNRSSHAATCCKATALAVGLIGLVAGAIILGLAANQNLGGIGSNGFIWGVTGGGCLVYASLNIEIIFAMVLCKKKPQRSIPMPRPIPRPRPSAMDDFLARNVTDETDILGRRRTPFGADVGSSSSRSSHSSTRDFTRDFTIPIPKKVFLPVSHPSAWPQQSEFEHFPELPVELQEHILYSAPFGALISSLGVSKEYYQIGQGAVILKARSFGYEGQNFAEAREYLKTFLKCVRSLSQFIDNPEFKTPCASIEEIEYRAVCLQKLTVEEIYSLYGRLNKDQIGAYSTLTAYFLLLIENKTITAKVGAKPQLHPLMIPACTEGDVNLLKLLLEIGVNPNQAFSNGSMPLHFAAQQGQHQAVELLLDHKADIEALSTEGTSALCFAVDKHKKKKANKTQVAETVRVLLEKGANPNLMPSNQAGQHFPPLHLAAINRYDGALQLLLNHEKTDIDSKNSAGNTLLCSLIESAQNENQILMTVLFLLQKKANPNLKSNAGETLLQLASERDFTGIVNLLLDFSVDINELGSTGSPVLLMLLERSRREKDIGERVSVYLERGADPSIRSTSGTTALHCAAEKGFNFITSIMLEKASNVDVQNANGETPLYNLLETTDDEAEIIETVRIFLSKGANPFLQTQSGDTPFHLAVTLGFTTILTVMLEDVLDVNVQNANGETPLYKLLEAAKDETEVMETVRSFLSRGANPFLQTQSGDTPFHLAVTHEFIKILTVMLEKVSYSDVQNGKGETPFYLALTRETDESLKLLVASRLIEKGANPNISTRDGRLALHHALLNSYWNVFRFLLEHGADVNAIGDEGHTPLIYAIRNPQKVASDEERLLIWLNWLFDQSKVDANQKNGKGKPPLYYALKMNNQKIIELLLSKGADVNAAVQGESLLMKVIVDEKLEESAKEALVDLLIAKGADLRFQSDRGSTIFHYAAFAGSLPLLEKFYNQVPDLFDKPDNKGLTPLCRAAKQGHQEAALFLRSKGADSDNLLKIIK